MYSDISVFKRKKYIINFKVKLTFLHFLSVIVFLASMNITYVINVMHLNSTFLWGIRMGIIGVYVILIIQNKKINRILSLITIWFMIIFLSTVINHGNILYMVNILSRCYLICIFVSYYSNNLHKLMTILETLKIIVLLLCILDLFSIIKYPNGMYQTPMYSMYNWLLGYKTARVVYILPLAYITCYLAYLKENSLRIGDYAILCLCIIDTYLSHATGGAVALLVYFLFIIFTELERRKTSIKRMHLFLNYRMILLAYIGFFWIIVVLQNSSMVSYIVEVFFDRESSFSRRLQFWIICLRYFRNHPIIGGGYMTTTEYVGLLNFNLASSPHNMVLSILMTVGIVGMGMYIYIFIQSAKRKNEEYQNYEKAIYYSIISLFILGLTSSAMVFSVYGLLPFVLLGIRLEVDKIKELR